jgi:hypothetical protein
MTESVPISETLNAARIYLRAGLSVIPVRAGYTALKGSGTR